MLGLFFDLRIWVLISLGLIATVLSVRNKMIFYYLAIPITIIFRNFYIKFPFPFFSSPLDVLVTIGIGLGLLNIASTRKSLPKTPLYPLIIVFTITAIIQVVSKSGNLEQVVALEKLIKGMWPFIMIILLLETPRQARTVLVTLVGTVIAASLLWLPGLLSAALAGDLLLLRSEGTAIPEGSTLVNLSLLSSMRSYLIIVPFSTLVAFSISLLVHIPRYRFFSMLATISLIVFTLSASIASGIVSLLFSMVSFAFLELWIQPSKKATIAPMRNIPMILIVMLIIIFVVLSLVSNSPIASQMFDRVLNPYEDGSASIRINLLEEAFSVAVASPLGTSSSYWYGGHDTLLSYQVNWGLFFTVPYYGALIIAVKTLLSMALETTRVIEHAIFIGMAATIIANVAIGLATPNLLELLADLIVWTFVGLAVVWKNWFDENPDTPLIN
jgi:hypothetical protein